MALNVLTAHDQQQQQQAGSNSSSSSVGWSVDQLHLAIEACRWVMLTHTANSMQSQCV
jgi:hypothetical protein